MSTRRPPQRADVRVRVVSDGTLRGTELHLHGGAVVRNVQSLDVHVGPDGATCTATIGHVAVDYGPADVTVADTALTLHPGPTPPER